MTGTPDYTVFVNSTDTFEDAWAPFFHLLGDYWPEVDKVVLNTETKDFSFPGCRYRMHSCRATCRGAVSPGASA